MNEPAVTWNAAACGALLPATERGNTISVTAEPPTDVPGNAPMSTVLAAPTSACISVNSAVAPPAARTLYMYVPTGTVTNDEAVSAATLPHVAAAGAVPP